MAQSIWPHTEKTKSAQLTNTLFSARCAHLTGWIYLQTLILYLKTSLMTHHGRSSVDERPLKDKKSAEKLEREAREKRSFFFWRKNLDCPLLFPTLTPPSILKTMPIDSPWAVESFSRGCVDHKREMEEVIWWIQLPTHFSNNSYIINQRSQGNKIDCENSIKEGRDNERANFLVASLELI